MPEEPTLFLLDWDDTLLASSWIDDQGLTLENAHTMTSEQRKHLDDLSARVSVFLQLLSGKGKIIIVTAANIEWVKKSVRAFLPKIADIIETLSVQSARDVYAHMYPDSPELWKRYLFYEIALDHLPETDMLQNTKVHIVSIGDSVFEQKALSSLVRLFPDNVLGKSIKLLEKTSICMLMHMLEIVCESIDLILNQPHSIDIVVHEKQETIVE